MFCPKSSPSHLYMFQYQYVGVSNPDHIPERSNTCPHSLWWRTPISQFPDFICCHKVFPSSSQRVPIKFPKCSSRCSRSITLLYHMVCLKLNFLVCVCVSIYIYLSIKEGSLFCFVVMRSTELRCFRSCSWCLWKALDKEGCMGLVPWPLNLGCKISWILNDFFTEN